MIKHMFKTLVRNKTKNTLMIIQFTFSLIALYMFITQVVNIIHAKTRDIGYETKNLITANMSEIYSTDTTTYVEFFNKMKIVISEVRELPFIKHAGFASAAPYGNSTNVNNKYVTVYLNKSSIDALGLKLVEGRLYEKEDAFDTYDNKIIITKATAEILRSEGHEKLIGEDAKKIMFNDTTGLDPWPIIGIVEEHLNMGRYNFNYKYYCLFLNKIDNEEYMLSAVDNIKRSPNMIIRTDGSIPDSKALFEINKIYKKNFPDINPSIATASELEIIRSKSTIAMFTILLVICVLLFFIISIGVIAITKENLLKRTREIGLRMALGSSEKQIINLFIGETLVLGLTAFAICSAIILSLHFSDILKFTIRWQEFVFTLLSLLSFLFLSIIRPVKKAASMKPNLALHHE